MEEIIVPPEINEPVVVIEESSPEPIVPLGG